MIRFAYFALLVTLVLGVAVIDDHLIQIWGW